MPTRRTVLLDTVAGLAAYGPGLAVVILLEGAARESFALPLGMLVFLVAYAARYQRLARAGDRHTEGVSPDRDRQVGHVDLPDGEHTSGRVASRADVLRSRRPPDGRATR